MGHFYKVPPSCGVIPFFGVEPDPPNKSIMMGWTPLAISVPSISNPLSLSNMEIYGDGDEIIDLPNETLTLGPPQTVLHHLGSNKIMAVLIFGTFTEQKTVPKKCVQIYNRHLKKTETISSF